MRAKLVRQGIKGMMLILALAVAPVAWGYDSAVKVGVGSFSLDYQEIGLGVTGTTGGLHIGYVGRFNDYIGFEARLGGAGESSNVGLAIQPGLFLSVFARPSYPIAEQVDIYALLGFTAMSVGRTTPGNVQEIIARGGSSFGIGGDYRINEHMAVGAEWVSYMRSVSYGFDANYSNWTNVPWAKLSFSGVTANFKYQF